MKTSKLPEGWQTKKLADLLTEEQIEALELILSVNDPLKWKLVRAYLRGLREELEAKGVVPEYLAYVLEYQLSVRESARAVMGKPKTK